MKKHATRSGVGVVSSLPKQMPDPVSGAAGPADSRPARLGFSRLTEWFSPSPRRRSPRTTPVSCVRYPARGIVLPSPRAHRFTSVRRWVSAIAETTDSRLLRNRANSISTSAAGRRPCRRARIDRHSPGALRSTKHCLLYVFGMGLAAHKEPDVRACAGPSRQSASCQPDPVRTGGLRRALDCEPRRHVQPRGGRCPFPVEKLGPSHRIRIPDLTFWRSA
jgi:hypothetical protein